MFYSMLKWCSNHSWGLETLLLVDAHILVFDGGVHYALDQSPAVQSDVSLFAALSNHCLKNLLWHKPRSRSWRNKNKITNINIIYEVYKFISFRFNRFHHSSSNRTCPNRFNIFCVHIIWLVHICIFLSFWDFFFRIFSKNLSVNAHWTILVSRFPNPASTLILIWIFYFTSDFRDKIPFELDWDWLKNFWTVSLNSFILN